MSTDYHTAYPAAMEYKTSNLNSPLGELDAQIGTNVTNIAANTEALKETIHVLATTTVDFSSIGETALHTTLSGEYTVLTGAVVRAGGDAGGTEITIGQSGEVTDFLNTQTLSNLDAAHDAVILQPVPNATPVKLKAYSGEVEIRINIETAEGVSINWVDLLGYTV